MHPSDDHKPEGRSSPNPFLASPVFDVIADSKPFSLPPPPYFEITGGRARATSPQSPSPVTSEETDEDAGSWLGTLVPTRLALRP
jgi:hypothetical protein